MCTAVTYKTKDFYFGRTLDYEFSYREGVTVTPRRFSFNFGSLGVKDNHYAIIGMAHIENNYPLYYDAINEKGLGMAALNFVGNAHYNKRNETKENVAQFEFIPWILCQCSSVKEARERLECVNLTDTPFSNEFPLAQLHWIIADENEAITVESVKTGIFIYDNPVGVLTNNPTFCEQMFCLNNYMHLSSKSPQNNFSKKLNLTEYSRGMGALGLPGDLSSQSRFIRSAFTKLNSVSGKSEAESIAQFFHILETVSQTRGCCEVGDSKYEITIYASCCNAQKGIYYYTTYENRQITAVDMYKENLDGCDLIHYPLIKGQQIRMQN